MSEDKKELNWEEKLAQLEKKLDEATAPKDSGPSVDDIANKINAMNEEKEKKARQERMVKQLSDSSIQEALPNVLGNDSVSSFMDRLKSGDVSDTEFDSIVKAAKYTTEQGVAENSRPVTQKRKEEDNIGQDEAREELLRIGVAFDEDPIFYPAHPDHRDRVKEYNRLYKLAKLDKLK